MDFLCDNENLYKRLMDYKNRSEREAVWDKFCENNLDKDACQRWFQSQCTLYRKVTHKNQVQGEPQLTEQLKLTRDNFDFLRDNIVNSGLQGGQLLKPVQLWAQHPDGGDMEPFQDTSHPESTCDPADMLRLDTHMPTPRSCGVSVTSSLADSDLQSALVES